MLKLTVKKTPHIQEWVARVTDNGMLLGSYYGDSRQDAQVTGERMLVEETTNQIKRAGDLKNHILQISANIQAL